MKMLKKMFWCKLASQTNAAGGGGGGGNKACLILILGEGQKSSLFSVHFAENAPEIIDSFRSLSIVMLILANDLMLYFQNPQKQCKKRLKASLLSLEKCVF